MFLFLLLANLGAFAIAAPSASRSGIVLVNPVRSQLPLIARVGSPYSWSISTSTFQIEDDQGHNTGAPLVYNASGLPRWLSFSTSTLSFTGTVPTSALPGITTVTITASASSAGDSVSDSFDLLISARTPPQLSIPLVQQFYDGNPAISGAFVVNPSSALAPYYTAATPREGSSSVGLRIPPTFEFSIGLQGATFAPWPLHYYALLVGGAPLPEWIKYNQGSFTFDGTAPDYVNGSLPEPMEVLIEASDAEGYSAGLTARQTFWLTIATRELKMKDGSRGIERNVSAGTGFVLDLMDGPEDNPWMGEIFWDAGFLPRDGIQKVSMNLTQGSPFAYDSVSNTLSGHITSSKIGQKLDEIPLAITDTQNISLNTLLVLSPVPSFFVLPPSNDSPSNTNTSSIESGEVAVPQNFSSPVSFDLSKYMASDGPSMIKNGAVKLTASIKPDVAKNWLSFDGTTLILEGTTPASGDFVDGDATTRSSPSMAETTGTGSVMHERRRHHHLQSQAKQVLAAAPTSESLSQHSPSSSGITAPTSSTISQLQLASSSANMTTVNITFAAHSLDSRTISTMRVILQLGTNLTCATAPCSSSTSSNDDGGSTDNAARVGLILALVFGSILLLVFVVACYRMRKNRTEGPKGVKSTDLNKDVSYILQRDPASDDTVMSPDAAWARNSVAYDGADLEKGAGEKRAHIHSMAETRSVATTMPQSGSNSGSGSRATTPTMAHGTHVVMEARTVAGQDDPGATSETSGSRYEDGTSIGTSYGVRAHGRGGSTSGSGTDKEAVTSGESDVDGGHLAPPKAYTRPDLSSRPISPAPSSATAASGGTLPKQKFFAKLKNFGARPRDDPSSQSSSGEEELPPKVPSKTSLFANTAPVTKPSVFASIMPAIKQSSLGSLLGMSNGENGSVKSKNSNRSHGKDSAKLDISNPRPLLPSLGAYLAKDYADQVARAAASGDIASRQPSDDGGSGFVAGNVIIYSMENRPLPITRPTTPTHAQPIFPAFVWPTQRQPEPGTVTAQNFYPSTQTSQRSVKTVNQTQSKPSSRADVPALLRNRSKEADIPQATSHDDSFSSSSDTSTLGGDGFVEDLVTGAATPKEVPRRRFDFGPPRGSVTESEVPISIISAVPGDASGQHSRVDSQESMASLAVVGTAALAVRSPLAPVKLVPSPKPSLSSTFDPGSATRQNSPKASIHSSPKSVHSAPTVQARLVQFIHEKQYDGGSSSEGVTTDDPVPGAYSTYQGKREISHKAVIEGYEPSPSEQWSDLPPAPAVQNHVPGSSSRLADKVKMLREQSRLYHEQQVNETASTQASSTRRTPSPTDDGLLNDPALALGLQYMQSFGSDGSLSSGRGNPTTPRPRVPSPEAGMGMAIGGEGNTSTGSVAGRAKVLNPGSIANRSRPRASQLQGSFIAYDNESHSSDSDRRTPPRIPLPTPPATETVYFDLSESSSGSTSSSSGSNVIVHRGGQERILVGVNEPFNFPSPLSLPGWSPGQSSRVRIIRAVKAAQQLRQQQQESDSSKSSDSDGTGTDVKLWAELENGGKLPDWLGFDPLEADFWGVPVPAGRGSNLKVKVFFRDGKDVTEVGRFIVEIVGR